LSVEDVKPYPVGKDILQANSHHPKPQKKGEKEK